MDKIDLIIDALELARNEIHDPTLWTDKVDQAIAAARELKDECREVLSGEPKYCPSENNAAYEKGFVEGMARRCELNVARAIRVINKPWVGLMDDEIKEVLGLNETPWSLSGVALQQVMNDVRALEAKLKEKNGE